MKARVGSVVVGSVVVVCLLAFIGCSRQQESSSSKLSDQPNACTLADLTVPLLDQPAEFHRSNGKPVTETVSFSVPMDGELCVVVTNGDRDPLRGQRVSAAWISIDGELVIGPDPFNQNTAEISAPHTVTAGEHELSVRLASKPGSFLTVQLILLAREQNAPVLSIAEDHLITDLESISFNVDIYDETAIDTTSFQAFLEGVDVSGSFTVTQTGAVSVPLGLPIIGANKIIVGVSDVFGNYGEVTGYVYRGEPGELPDAFAVIEPGVGGEVAVTDPSSPVFGVTVEIPPGAVESEQTVTIGHNSGYFGRPDGMIAVGPAVELGPDIEFSQDVLVTLPFSGSLLDFFRTGSTEVEVWKYDGGWIRLGGEVFPSQGRLVQVETDSFSTLQPWIKYPQTLLMDTIAGGGDKDIEIGGPVLADMAMVEYPTLLASLSEDIFLFDEYNRSSLNVLLRHGDSASAIGLLEARAPELPGGGEKRFTAIATHSGPGCVAAALCFFYAVAQRSPHLTLEQ